jgi:subtilase-type serine protease
MPKLTITAIAVGAALTTQASIGKEMSKQVGKPSSQTEVSGSSSPKITPEEALDLAKRFVESDRPGMVQQADSADPNQETKQPRMKAGSGPAPNQSQESPKAQELAAEPVKAKEDLLIQSASKTPIGLSRPDAERLEFTSLEALKGSIFEVMKAFLMPGQLVDLERGLMLTGPSQHSLSGLQILKNYEEERAKPGFNELRFRQKLLVEIGSSYGLELTPVEITPVATETPATTAGALKPAYLLAALPLAALGGGGGGGGGGSGATAVTFETTEYLAQYGLGKISASTAYARGYTGSGVTVSVVDDRFDLTHPEFSGRFTTGYNAFTRGTDVDCAGSCAATHGTFVAGIIGANKDSAGMHGVAYGTTIKPVAIGTTAGSLSVSNAELANAIAAASGVNITVMNNSWGYSQVLSETISGVQRYIRAPAHLDASFNNTSSTPFAASVNTAFQNATASTVIVFANGNHGFNTVNGRTTYYATSSDASNRTNALGTALTGRNRAGSEGRHPLVNSNVSGKWITVAALDNSNTIASYSNGCGDAAAFCISAPGSSVYSTLHRSYNGTDYSNTAGDSYGTGSGTSFAAPHVAAAIAILKQQFPNLTPTQLVDLLLSTATDLGDPGTDEVYGRGLLNLGAATTPQGVLRVATGGALANDLYTTQNTGFRVSRVMGSSLAGLKVGVLDGYNRSYEWSPTISRTSTINFKPSSYFPANSKQTTMLAADNIELRGELTNTNSGSQLTGTTLSWSADPVSVSLNYASLQQRLPTWSTNASINPSELFAFQVSPGITGLTSISAAHQFGGGFSLFFSTATAGYENGGAFSENSYGLTLSSQNYHVIFRAGLLSEKEQFLGTTGYGAYSMGSPARTTFWSLGSSLKLSEKTVLSSRYSAAKTAVKFKYEELASSSDILTDEFQVSLSRTGIITATGTLSINMQAPLSIKAGQINQSTTLGYTANGDYNTVQRSYSLVGDNRERVLSLVFRQPGKRIQGFAGLFTRLNADGTRGSVDTGIRLGLTSTF